MTLDEWAKGFIGKMVVANGNVKQRGRSVTFRVTHYSLTRKGVWLRGIEDCFKAYRTPLKGFEIGSGRNSK